MLCEGSVVATEEVISILAERLDLGLRHFSYLPHNELFSTEVHLLCELCAIQDDLWARRLQLLLTTVFKGMAFLSSPLICERLLLPCLRLVGRLALPAAAATENPATGGSAALEVVRSSAAGGGAASAAGGRLSAGADAMAGLMPVSLRTGSASESMARLAAASGSGPQRRLGGVRSLLAPQLGLSGAPAHAAAAAAVPSVSSTQQLASSPAAAAASKLGAAARSATPVLSQIRIIETGATVRFDSFLQSPDEMGPWRSWIDAAAPGGGSSSAVTASAPVAESSAASSLTLTDRQRQLCLKFGRRWRANACVVALPATADGTWLCKLLLCEASQSIREEAVVLITSLAAQPAGRAIRFLDLLIGLLPAVVASPRCAPEFFELLRHLMAPESHRLYLVARGLLRELCKLIGAEARRLREQEDSCMVDMMQGSMLKNLVEILSSLVELPTVLSKFRREEQLPVLLHTLLCVRGLVMQKTSATHDCATKLQPLLTSLHEGSEPDRRRFMAACVASMREHASGRSSDGRSLIFLFEQLCSIVCPELPEPEYKLILNKTSTQEEFIRGAMVKNPYSSKQVGPLMRDVKNKICRDLDLGGLIEDDNGMELLVAGSIVKLDLSVAAVYEQVWAKAQEAGSPMVVVYRLQGLDGEATEPIVETVSEDSGEELDPEAEYAISEVVGETDGLTVMMDILARSTPLLRVRECAALLLKLLQHCCKIRTNRARMLEMKGTQRLLRMLPEALENECLGGVAERIAYSIESLLDDDLTRSLAPSAAEDGSSSAATPMEVEGGGAPGGAVVSAAGGGSNEVVDLDEWSGFLKLLLQGLTRLAVREQKQTLVKVITRLLPMVTRGESRLIAELIAYFDTFALHFEAYDDGKHADESHTFGLECLVATFTSMRPSSALAQRVKQAVIDHGLASRAAAYLVRHLPANMDAGSQQWSAALARPALPFVLQLLGGLASGHVGIQDVLLSFRADDNTPELMTRLHALERQSSSASKAIGTLAESLLEALRERAAADVDRLRKATSESKRKAALDKRQRILQSMGMGIAKESKSGSGAKGAGGKVIVAQAKNSLMMELEEESGHVCVVCGEGETYRPGEALGCYSFCRRVPLFGGAGGGSQSSTSPGRSPSAASEMCYTSVSHFNLIHFSCHRDATRAERTLKQPKEEWEGATLRNSQTKCNNLMPIYGASVSEEAYAMCVEQWWANMAHIGRVDAPRCRLVVHDIKLLLLRFALEESFSTYSKGGGRESNLKMLPYLVQMATFLFDASSMQRRAHQQALSTYVTALAEGTVPTTPAAAAAASAGAGFDTPVYMLVSSLLLHSLAEWKLHRVAMLKQAAVYWKGAGSARERFSLAGPASPSTSAARSPSLAPARSPGGSAGGAGSSSGAGGSLLPPSAVAASLRDANPR